jgi:hypothetical protein
VTQAEDLAKLKENLADRKAAFFERLRMVCDADAEYRKAMGCRDFEQYIKGIVKNTASEIERMITAFERKWPD